MNTKWAKRRFASILRRYDRLRYRATCSLWSRKMSLLCDLSKWLAPSLANQLATVAQRKAEQVYWATPKDIVKRVFGTKH